MTHVESLQAAFEALDQDVFDMTLLDLGLPDSQGLNTLLKFQTQAPHHLPIVVLTGLADIAFATQLVQQGAQDYLIKGELDQNWLRNTITYTVARSRWITHQYQQRESLKNSNQALQCQVRDYRTELTRMGEQLQQLEARASTDALTGIANRYGLEQRVEQEWFYARKQQRHLSLIMIEVMMELPQAQPFGESTGHLWRDECLRQVAKYLKEVLNRPRDLVARYEGREFCVVLPDMLKEGAVQMATDLYEEIHELAIRHPDPKRDNWVTIRFGVASAIPTLNATPSDFFEEASQALYAAKTGRDRLARLQPPIPTATPTLAPAIDRLLA